MKRFAVTSATRDREYTLTKGSANSKVLYFSTNPNGEAEIIRVYLRSNPRIRKNIFEVDFSTQLIRGRNTQGNILTKHPVLKIIKIEEGVSTLGGRKIYFNFETKRLNDTEYGDYLGEFKGSDKILVITEDGKYSLTTFDLSNHYEIDIHRIEKFNPKKQWSAVFFDAERKYYYIKRFEIEETSKYVSFIGDNEKSKLIAISDDEFPQIEVQFGGKHAQRENEYIDVEEFIAVKGFKARGKRITTYTVKKITFTEPLNKNNTTTQESENKDNDSKTNNSSKQPKTSEKKPSNNENGAPNQMSLF